jgi:putative colanic acid biosynthesis glycosyltransferase
MFKVLQINTALNTGSTGRIAEQIGKIAIDRGWESYIAYGRKGNESLSKSIKVGSEFDFYIHLFYTRLFDKHGLASIKATKKLIEDIIAIKPDIIHLHNLHGYYVNYELLFQFFKNSTIPVVWTLHDCWPFTGHCSYFSNISCEKWKVNCGKCPKKKNYPRSWFFDRSKYNFSLKKETYCLITNLTIVPVSHWLGSLVKESILSNFPMCVIHNGINNEDFKLTNDIIKIREKYCINHRHILLGVATSWSIGKGLKDYFKLATQLPENCVIVLVGLTKQQIQKLPNEIIGIERTESVKELAGLYSLADIVLNLSYQETFGMTTVEGFACGTPGIVYNLTASPELITPETGIVIEPGNISNLRNAIDEILSKGKEFYSSKCRERAEEMYSAKIQYEKYLALYEELIQTAKNRNKV